jgi:hypothetical protein
VPSKGTAAGIGGGAVFEQAAIETAKAVTATTLSRLAITISYLLPA